MSRNKMSGFTLIELMVVIVIIGVLASLAIPRFTEASMKAKVQDGPKVLASYETSFLAGYAEKGDVEGLCSDLMFKLPNDNWFKYSETGTGLTKGGPCDELTAEGDKGVDIKLVSTFDTETDAFTRVGTPGSTKGAPKQISYVQNFIDAGTPKK